MCGISGYLDLSGAPADPRVAEAMATATAHRGPDGQGVYSDGPLALGHRRLAVLDLSDAGRQPMATPDGRFVIVYNGEVYNFRDLRRELETCGHTFLSRTDTEVVLAAWAEWGPAALDRFNGMFAFAIWDRKEGALWLARDRYGIKPSTGPGLDKSSPSGPRSRLCLRILRFPPRWTLLAWSNI